MGEVGVHQAHCCNKHGCKYGDSDCPVEVGLAPQEYPCETCSMSAPQEGGFYDAALVWHPPVHEILERVATELGEAGTGQISPGTLDDLQRAARDIRGEV